MRTRWCLRNGVTLCQTCHRLAHANPQAFGAWIEAHVGADTMTALRDMATPRGTVALSEMRVVP